MFNITQNVIMTNQKTEVLIMTNQKTEVLIMTNQKTEVLIMTNQKTEVLMFRWQWAYATFGVTNVRHFVISSVMSIR